MVSPGIRFNDCHFTEPTRLTGWRTPKFAGLFVLLARDANWAPKPYEPLYFGEFGNNTPEGALPGGHALARRGQAQIYISVLPMPFSTTAQRLALLNELAFAYNAPWQSKEVRAVSGLASQFGNIDSRSAPEQAAQILLLLANKLLEPQAEPGPRRRIGFVP